MQEIKVIKKVAHNFIDCEQEHEEVLQLLSNKVSNLLVKRKEKRDDGHFFEGNYVGKVPYNNFVGQNILSNTVSNVLDVNDLEAPLIIFKLTGNTLEV